MNQPPDRGADAPIPLSRAANEPPSLALREAADALSHFDGPPRGESFGDADGAPILEVAVSWRGVLRSVRHVGPKDRLVAHPPRGPLRRPFVLALVVALLLGVGQAMVRHAALPEPERLPAADAALIADWTARNDEALAAARAERQRLRDAGEEPPTPDPGLDPLAQRSEAWAAARARDRRAKVPPPERFHPAYAPDLEDWLEAEVLPAARERVRRVGLTQGEVDLFDRWSPYALPGGPAAGADLSPGDRVQHRGEPHAVIQFDPKEGYVLLADARGRVRSGAFDAAFELLAEDPDQLARIERAAAELLLADAERKGSFGQACRAAERLLEHGAFAVLARHGECLTRKGDLAAAGPILEQAAAARPLTPTDAEFPHLRRFLRARARLLLATAEQPGPAAATAPRRHAARAAHAELRRLLIERVQDPAALAAVDHGLHRIAQLDRDAQADRLVAQALRVAAVALFLLPVAMLLDERRRTPGLELPADELHGAHPLVLPGGRVALLPGAQVSLSGADGDDDRAALQARGRLGGASGVELHLRDNERLLQCLGEQVVAVRRVAPPKAVVALPEVDWRFLGSLAAATLLAVTAGLGAWRQAGDIPTEIFLKDEASSIRLAVPVELPELLNPGEEGQGAQGAEGASGPKKPSPLKTASRMRAAKSAEVRDLIDTMFADQGFEYASGSEMPDLVEASLGLFNNPLDGAGGESRGFRGPGPGGGGDGPIGIGGVGTRPGGTGGPDGDRNGLGIGKRTQRTPPPRTHDPILVGTYSKAMIDRVVKFHLNQIRYCYEQELSKNPRLSGKVVVKFIIGKDGSVSSATTAQSSLKNSLVEQCVNRRFLRFHFPPPKHGIVSVRYPFVFTSGG